MIVFSTELIEYDEKVLDEEEIDVEAVAAAAAAYSNEQQYLAYYDQPTSQEVFI
jgi:hypothetical protein